MEKHEIFNIIYSAIIEISPWATEQLAIREEAGKQDVFLVDLGINSIDYAEITNIVMDKLNIEHSLDIFTRSNRIGDLVDIFYNLIAAKLSH